MLNGFPAVTTYSEAIAVGIVVVLSYVSVIVGELVPKRIALSNLLHLNDLRRQIALIQEPMKRLEQTLGKLHYELMMG